MPHQNRVTPFGELVADPARGTVMGNRGCLHDTGDHPLRQYQTKSWLICKLDFNNRRRPIMAPGQYTELFFLDEVTALAAGHRPCYECNRTKFHDFANHWNAASPHYAKGASVNSDSIDTQLHCERITEAYYQKNKRKRIYLETLDTLPDGCFIALGMPLEAYLVHGLRLFPWRVTGYSSPIIRPKGISVAVLTPYSTVCALAHGYHPDIHPTAEIAAV